MFVAMIAAAALGQEPGAWEALDACRAPVTAPADDPDFNADEEQVGCLVTALYAPGQLERIDVLGEHAPLIFSPAALADMDAARARTMDGLTPGMDADPFCLCQDPSGLTVLAVMTTVSRGGTGSAAVVFTFGSIRAGMTPDEMEAALAPDQRRVVRLDFERRQTGWYVNDIVGEGWSFRRGLAR